MQRAMPLVSGRLVPLAIIAAANIVLDLLSHPWPVEVPTDHLNGFIHPHMTGDHTVMFALKDKLLKGLVVWDPDLALTVEHTVSVRDVLTHLAFYAPIGTGLLIEFLPNLIVCGFLYEFLLHMLSHFYYRAEALHLH